MVSDPGRATAPRITVQPVLPSTVLSGSASAMSSFSGLNTYPIRSLCTFRERRHRRPRNTRYRAARYDPTRAGLPPAGPRQLRLAHQHSLPGGRYPYLGRTCTGWIAPASPGAPEALIKLLYRWRDEAVKAGCKIKRIVVGFEAGRDGFWLARWL